MLRTCENSTKQKFTESIMIINLTKPLKCTNNKSKVWTHVEFKTKLKQNPKPKI